MPWPALEDLAPGLIFENAPLYSFAGELAEAAGPVEIALAKVLRPGERLSLITHAGSVPKTLEAAGNLGAKGVSASRSSNQMSSSGNSSTSTRWTS